MTYKPFDTEKKPDPPDQAELEWLRFFYAEAGYAMGPADGDIYRMLAREFKRKGNSVPAGYEDIFGEG